MKTASEGDSEHIREMAGAILAATNALKTGNSMETRGERERRIKELVREGFELFGGDQSALARHVSPKIVALCDGDCDLAGRLGSEAAAEIVASNVLQRDRRHHKPAGIRHRIWFVVVIITVASITLFAIWRS
jgi:hypothetical protein